MGVTLQLDLQILHLSNTTLTVALSFLAKIHSQMQI